jgi:hypothetical protein
MHIHIQTHARAELCTHKSNHTITHAHAYAHTYLIQNRVIDNVVSI